MKAWKIYVPLLAATAIGFAVIRMKTDKPGKPEPDKTKVDPARYRATAHVGAGGEWFAQVLLGAELKQQLGPFPSEAEALAEAAKYIANLDVVAFYTLRSFEVTPGKFDWFFDGWSRGELVSADNGPFASKAVAMTAGDNWVAASEGSM